MESLLIFKHDVNIIVANTMKQWKHWWKATSSCSLLLFRSVFYRIRISSGLLPMGSKQSFTDIHNLNEFIIRSIQKINGAFFFTCRIRCSTRRWDTPSNLAWIFLPGGCFGLHLIFGWSQYGHKNELIACRIYSFGH